MRPEALILYATNESQLYEKHKELARNNADLNTWIRHIVNEVLPAYRKEFREKHEGLSTADLERAAGQLQTYYLNHIAEGA